MSDSPFPSDKRGKNPRSLANLRKPFGKGECHNPEGKNGRTRAEILAAVMDEPSESDPKRSKIEMVVRAQYRRALKGSDQAAKMLIEQYGGKPTQKVDLQSSDGSMSGGGYPVVVQLPANGRPMNEDAEPSTEAQSNGDGAEND